MSLIPSLLSAAPFILFLILLFGKRFRLIWVSSISLILVTVIAVFYWKMFPVFILGSLEKGFFVALDIFFIIFGAILFLEILREIKIIENIGRFLESISKDLRVQVILLAWFFENFLEGTAGFGTPATVVAPLLIGLGITPINAVILSLMGNSTAGVFGAAGTPIKIGFSGLAGSSLPIKASVFNAVGILVPVFMLWFLTRDKKNGNIYFLEAIPFAIWSGVVFVGASVVTVFLGQEFPSIVGSVLGLAIVLVSIKVSFLTPKKVYGFVNNKEIPLPLPLKKVLFPYLLLIALLILGKLVLGNAGVALPILLKHSFSYFNPGFVFMISGLLITTIYRVSRSAFLASLNQAFHKSLNPFLVIIFMSSIAQMMVNSSHNLEGLPSMINVLASNAKNALLPFWAPVAGAFGSFLTGSVTVSSLMFGNFLAAAARDLSFDIDGILALGVVGGALGNMIALADILVAEAVVGMKHREIEVLKGVIWPCLILVLSVGFIGVLVL